MLLLDQQLYETEQSLRDARRQLARLMAEEKLNQRRAEELSRQSRQYEEACQALARWRPGVGYRQASGGSGATAKPPARQGVTLEQQKTEFQAFIKQAADTRKPCARASMARSQEIRLGNPGNVIRTSAVWRSGCATVSTPCSRFSNDRKNVACCGRVKRNRGIAWATAGPAHGGSGDQDHQSRRVEEILAGLRK